MKFSYHAIESEALPVQLTGMGSQNKQCQINRPNGFPRHQLIFSRKGQGELSINGSLYTVKEGEYFYLEPFAAHHYKRVSEEWSTDWLLFDSLSKDIINVLGLISQPRPIPKAVDHIFYDMAGMIAREEKHLDRLLSGQLYQLLINTSLDDLEGDNQFSDVIDYIDEHYKRDITLDQLAGLMKITPHYFCKIFKLNYKLRPMEYMTEVRLKHAKALLLGSDLTIKRIANEVGFRESAYFGKVFKDKVGMTPSAYRG